MQCQLESDLLERVRCDMSFWLFSRLLVATITAGQTLFKVGIPRRAKRERLRWRRDVELGAGGGYGGWKCQQ
jgi:hypothetical protein